MVDNVPAGDNKNKEQEELARILSERGESQTLEALNTESNAPRPTLSEEPAQTDQDLSTPVTAGTRNYGGDATSTQEQNRIIETLAQNNIPSPQDQLNQDRAADYVYVAGNASETLQWNGIQSGSNAGNLAGIAAVEQRRDMDVARENEKKRNQDAILLSAAAAYAASFKQLRGDYQNLKNDADKIAEQLDEAVRKAEESLQELREEIKTLEETRDEKREQIKTLEENYNNAQTPEEKEYALSELKLARAELNNTETVLKLYQDSSEVTSTKIRGARSEMAETIGRINSLGAAIDKLEKSGEDPTALEELKTKLDQERAALNEAQTRVDDLKKQATFIKNVGNYELHLQSMDCSRETNLTDQKTALIEKRTAIVSAIITAAQDGTITKVERAELAAMAKEAKLDDKAIEDFARGAAEAGLIRDDNGQKVAPDDALEFLKRELEELDKQHTALAKEEKTLDTKATAKQSSIEDLQRREAELERNIAAGDQKLGMLQTELSRESAETAKMVEDQQKLEAGWGEHTSVKDFMSENYSIFNVGGGEKIDDVSKDASRYIRDREGNVVYMNSDSTLFTLQKEKNPDGSVKIGEDGFPVIARDANGDQIRVPVKLEEQGSLRAQLLSEKKLFGNFMDDGIAQKTVGESADGLGKWTTLASSIIGMSKEADQKVMADYIAEQKRQQTAAAQSLSSAESDINKTRSAIAQTQAQQDKMRAELAAIRAERAKVSAEKAEVAEKIEDVEKQIQERGGEVTDLKLDTPKYTPEQAADWKAKLDSVSSITPEGIERLKAEAAQYGFKADDVEDTLKANKVEIKSNIYADAQPQQVASAAPASAPIVYYPLIGASTPRNEISPFIAKPETGGVAGGVKFGSVLDEYPQYNKDPNATYLAQTNNKTDNAPVAAQSFSNALLATQTPDAARLAAEADQRRLDQERLEQELMRQRLMAASGGGIGMSSTTGGAQGA